MRRRLQLELAICDLIHPATIPGFPEISVHGRALLAKSCGLQDDSIENALFAKHAKESQGFIFRSPKALQLLDVHTNIELARARPLHLYGKVGTVAVCDKIDPLEVTRTLPRKARTRDFALHGEAACREDSKCRLVQDVLAKRLVHFARSKIADVAGQPALDSVQDV